MSGRTAGRWALWFGMLALVTAVFLAVRSQAEDQSFIPLAFLLVVLGGSIGAGHRLGFALAAASFLLMDYFFQSPYYRVLTFGGPADFVTLLSFFAVAGVASQLLDSARRERELAVERTDEVLRLSRERTRLIAEAEHAQALREAERLKDFVLTSVSHDLRTPLTTIKALAQEEQRTGASRGAEIEEQADRLSRMVSDLLDLSRLRSGTFTRNLELNAAEDVIGAAVRQIEGIRRGRRVSARVDPGAPAVFGRFDFLLTLRVLGNLIENALRFTPEDGEVEVSSRREEGMIVLAVADRGPGIPAEERERIFEPFYRPDGAQPDLGRAGLGLAIARALAQVQGGSLRCDDRPGGGTIFELWLPAADVELEAEEP